MRFLAPIAFWFALSIPVVIAFYLLKRKRTLKLVPSTLLWQKFLNDTQANAPFQRLRHNWLLLLQLLLLLLAVIALARPYIGGQQTERRLRVVVLDASASMQATDVKPTRFEAARAQALAMVESLREGEQMMVLLAGSPAEVRQSPTTDKSALRRALRACAPSDSPGRVVEALKTAGAFTWEKRNEEEVTFGEIHLFSDGAFGELGDLANRNLPLTFHQIGTSRNNLALVAVEARTHPENPAQRALFVSIANYATNARSADVEMLFGDRLIETRPVDIPPTNTAPLVFTAPQPQDGIFTVRLRAEDDLPLDNQVFLASTLPRTAKVLLVTRGNRFLERAIRRAPNIALNVASSYSPSGPAKPDILVLDDITPPAWPTENVLAIHTASPLWFTNWSTVKTPLIVDWRNTHPLLRFVSLDNVAIAEALAVKTPPWGLPVVDSPQTPLILAGEKDRQRIVWLGFDTLQSTWPLRVSFPIFILNAMDWLNPHTAAAGTTLVKAGDPFRILLPDAPQKAEVRRPDGSTFTLDVAPNSGEVIVGDTAHAGVYQLKAGTNTVSFCVNLLNSEESNIAPKQELPMGKYAKIAATSFKRSGQELWRWFALAGLAVLLFEWWYYHRRTV